MALEQKTLDTLAGATDGAAWGAIVESALKTAAGPLAKETAPGAAANRDSAIGELDLFLSSCGWELWHSFHSHVTPTSAKLVQWWGDNPGGKAALILDALSLRELPWLLQGAQAHGFSVHKTTATASELPGTTDAFAHALGFAHGRGQLANNGGGSKHKLQPAGTESTDMNWVDCQGLVKSSPNIVFWHHWFDDRLHGADNKATGLDVLTKEAATQLSSDGFWGFAKRLANGRRLVITSDHGYAYTGAFSDEKGGVKDFLKAAFAAGRCAKGPADPGPYLPPIALRIDNQHGANLLALGRRKWAVSGGHPKLAHGGLTLLEVLCPWVELNFEGEKQ